MPTLPFADTMALLDALDQARARRTLTREQSPAVLRQHARTLCDAQGLVVDDATLEEAVTQFQSIYPDTSATALADPHARRSQTPWQRPADAQQWQARRDALRRQERRWVHHTRWGVGLAVGLTILGIGVSLWWAWLGLGLILTTQVAGLVWLNRATPWFQRPLAWRRELDQLDPLPLPALRAICWWGVPAVIDQARQWLATDVPLLIGDGAELDARAAAARQHLRTRLGHRLLHGVIGAATLFERASLARQGRVP